MTTPTQVRRPWRATIRTAFAVLVAFAAMFPLIVGAAGVDETLPPVVTALAIATGITRVMALPVVDDFLAQFLPWLAADPPHRAAVAGFLDGPDIAPALVASVACHICPGVRFELPITSGLWGFTTVTDLADITVTAPWTKEFGDHMNKHRVDGTFAAKLLEHAADMSRRADLMRGHSAPE